MLMYGRDTDEVVHIQFYGERIVYNLSSLREGYYTLRLLLPPIEVGRGVDREFDTNYYQYILSNDYVFAEFFQIVYNLYTGVDVFLLVADTGWSENILESLLKIIQQRYGYNAVQIESDEDYIYAYNNMDFSFTPYGLYNLDQDKDRFTRVIESYRQAHGGALPYPIKWTSEYQLAMEGE